MKILVIKQTSLGDVLHSTGHVRAIKHTWPSSELILLTATSSVDIYRHSPWVDKMIVVDRYRVKHGWYREPAWAWRHMVEVMRQVRSHQFDLAFDLQGLAKSVVFLYGARARRKFVKGRWPGLTGFRKPELHAIEEMDGVLKLGGIEVADTSMELTTSEAENDVVASLLREQNPDGLPVVILSPFSRWPSKDWPFDYFLQIADHLSSQYKVFITGAPDRQQQIAAGLMQLQNTAIVSLAGRLNLLEFAALVKRAQLMLTGDSFPMHVAAACHTPLIALFGPTDESRVGPRSPMSRVIRAPDCSRCDRRDCQRKCLNRILPATIETVMVESLSTYSGSEYQ